MPLLVSCGPKMRVKRAEREFVLHRFTTSPVLFLLLLKNIPELEMITDMDVGRT